MLKPIHVNELLHSWNRHAEAMELHDNTTLSLLNLCFHALLHHQSLKVHDRGRTREAACSAPAV